MQATAIDQVWVLACAVLVFLMQGGFLCVEVGFVRRKNATATAMKNAIDWVMACLAFFLVGFGLMFGPTAGGWIGSGFFALDGLAGAPGGEGNALVFFLFQLGFVGTAVTIVSGALAERASFNAYLLGSFVMAVLIYPVFGHWAWGGTLVPGSVGWLAGMGYVDFAGSSVVHVVGGCVALVGARIVGPRLGRFDAEGRPRPMDSHFVGLSVLGVLILWVGWWGFNGGSTLRFDAQAVGTVLLNTNLAGASGGLAAFLHGWFAQRRSSLDEKFLGGALGGLVAVTASCHIVSPLAALAIGGAAGIVHNLAFEALLRKRIDDPVGAIPVHLACGAWGILALAFFADPERLQHGRLAQLGVQALGLAACIAWSGLSAWLMFQVLRATIGLRVSPEEEQAGLRIAGGVAEKAPADEAVDPALLLELLGRESER